MTKELTQEEVEKKLQEIVTDFNTNSQKLTELETKIEASKDETLSLLKEIYRRSKSKTTSNILESLEKKYEDAVAILEEDEAEHHKLLRLCYKKLEVVRQAQVNYWSSIANALQTENKKLQEFSSNRDSPEIKNEIRRENNLE